MNEAPTSAGRLGFRADINGLRAAAVLAVLGYHFHLAGFRGGFAGVDAFFVISGYLMTGIILSRMERGTFTVLGFYLDRARRIVPALVALIAAVLIAVVPQLLPDEAIILSRHAGSSAIFLSNIAYFLEGSSYFDGIENSWLLHTWSLSVEWQFYLLYPLFMLAAARLSRARLFHALSILAALSLALVLYLSTRDPRAGFYLLPSRAWEMLAGGLVYLTPPLSGARARAAQLAGFALILGTVLLAGSAAWPGAATLAPVIGTALVILAGRTESRITGNPVARWIGLISYSLYLWHWPIVVYLTREDLLDRWPYAAGGLLLAFGLGYLSWRFVERLAQRGEAAPRIHTGPLPRPLLALLPYAIAVSVPLAACAGLWISRGLPGRFSPEVLAVAADAQHGSPFRDCFTRIGAPGKPCVIEPERGPVAVTMLGDSHADALVSALVAAVPASAGSVAFNAYAFCPPVLGALGPIPENRCEAFNARFLTPQTAKRATPLVIAAFWPGYLDSPGIRFAGGNAAPSAREFGARLERTACALSAGGPTYMMLPTPEFPFNVARELRHRLTRDPAAPEITQPVAMYFERNREILPMLRAAAQHCGVKLLDPLPYLCPNGQCLGSIRHRAVYSDRHHLSEYGNKLLQPLLATVVAAP